MKERILNGWTWQRAIYLILGSLIIIQAAMEKQWLVMVIGIYFASMGLFSFGCAAGNCLGGHCTTNSKQESKTE